jgi:hypothetical protein
VNLSKCLLPIVAAIAVSAVAQPMPKARVADLIRKVENGVDEFRDYLKRRGENAQSAQGQAKRPRRGTASESQKAAASARKDDLDDALGELNRSTNRLRRKFDPLDNWMETKVEVDRVLDDGRKINQVVARGNYGAEAARLWGVLRAGINDLARAYNLPPMAM